MMGNSHIMPSAFKGCVFNTTNLSLGGTIRNVTPEIFVIHSTLRQHKIHINKAFQSKLFIKDYPSHVKFKILIKFTIKCVLRWKMNA
jgi:hypothetical protein